MCCFSQRLHDISGSVYTVGAAVGVAVGTVAAEVAGLVSATEGSVVDRETPREWELLLDDRAGLECVGSVVRRDVAVGATIAPEDIVNVGVDEPSELIGKADRLGDAEAGFELVVSALLARKSCLSGSVVLRSLCDIRLRLGPPDSEVDGRSVNSPAERAACLDEVTESAAGGLGRDMERVLPWLEDLR